MLGFKPAPEVAHPQPPPYVAPQAQREPQVFRGGRHRTRNPLACPTCRTTTARRGQCLNRACSAFNGALARTNPDLLSLDRATRVEALWKWAHGGRIV